MSVLYKHGNADVRGNFTPMIDMVFLLIVFFVLVSRIVDVESVEMNLPQPKDAVTVPLPEDKRVIVNVRPDSGGRAKAYRVGGRDFEPNADGVAAMTAHLAALYRANPAINVNIRADRMTHYEFVEPAMSAVAAAARQADSPAAAARVNLVVVGDR
jgi:biopolymer transport protein ExbD